VRPAGFEPATHRFVAADQPNSADPALRVQESWIIRWLGGVSDKAVSDFRRGAEAEADRFSRECLYALRDDVVTVLSEGG